MGYSTISPKSLVNGVRFRGSSSGKFDSIEITWQRKGFLAQRGVASFFTLKPNLVNINIHRNDNRTYIHNSCVDETDGHASAESD